MVAGAVLAGLLDAVGVVLGALDDTRVAAFPFRVELPRVGDGGHDPVKELFPLIRGKSRVISPADDADGPLELHPVRVDAGVRRGGADQGADPRPQRAALRRHARSRPRPHRAHPRQKEAFDLIGAAVPLTLGK
jgi:hypothetical protein